MPTLWGHNEDVTTTTTTPFPGFDGTTSTTEIPAEQEGED